MTARQALCRLEASSAGAPLGTDAPDQRWLAEPLAREAEALATGFAAAMAERNTRKHVLARLKADRRAVMDRLIPLTRVFLTTLKLVDSVPSKKPELFLARFSLLSIELE